MTVFLVIGCIGFFLLVFSAIFGGETDGDADHIEIHCDVDHDIGHDISHEFHAESDHDHSDAGHDSDGHNPSIFNMKVISIFMTSFGMTGVVCQRMGYSTLTSTLAGLMVGVILGAIGWWIVRIFFISHASSTISDQDLVGCHGKISIDIPNEAFGEVEVMTKSQRLFLLARSADGSSIPKGVPVQIVRSADGFLVVVVDKIV